MIEEAGKFGEVVCGWSLIGEVTEKRWAARLGHYLDCERRSESFAEVVRSGKKMEGTCM